MPDVPADAAAAVITVEHLHKAYGATVAVDDVSFAVRAGEIFGVLGRNGAGKTTTVECLSGLRVPDSGRGARAVLPGMLDAGGGCITMISATSAFRPVADFATAYSSAKAGLNGLMLCIAATYGGRGVRCNSIAPGLILVDPSASQDAHRDLTKGLVQRPGRPSDIASIVRFLSSASGSYVNGQVISIDGGLTAHMPGLSNPVVG